MIFFFVGFATTCTENKKQLLQTEDVVKGPFHPWAEQAHNTIPYFSPPPDAIQPCQHNCTINRTTESIQGNEKNLFCVGYELVCWVVLFFNR